MIITVGSILCTYMLEKSELAQDLKSFGNKLNFFKKNKNNYPEIINKYKNKEFTFWEIIQFEVYDTIFCINTLEWIMNIWQKEFKLIQDENSFVESVKFLENELYFEIKRPWEFWHTNEIKIPYWILFHQDFINKYKTIN